MTLFHAAYFLLLWLLTPAGQCADWALLSWSLYLCAPRLQNSDWYFPGGLPPSYTLWCPHTRELSVYTSGLPLVSVLRYWGFPSDPTGMQLKDFSGPTREGLWHPFIYINYKALTGRGVATFVRDGFSKNCERECSGEWWAIINPKRTAQRRIVPTCLSTNISPWILPVP